MNDHEQPPQHSADLPAGYHPPTVTYVGDLADLTQGQKMVGAADGATFLGIDIGSVP